MQKSILFLQGNNLKSPNSPSSIGQSSRKQQQPKEDRWLAAWYGPRCWTFWLLPLTGLFILLASLRRFLLLRYSAKKLATPVIVVGNISVGGTGKTPLLIALVKWLQQQGFNPGVISRGYGGKAPDYPYLLDCSSTAAEAGDEPITIFQQTGCSVCVGSDRLAVARFLEDQSCDILLSDDGLQHYRLARDIEIAVVDGQRGLGNGWRIPVGPLREPASRLKNVDWVIVNSPDENFVLPGMDGLFYIPMRIEPQDFINLKTGEKMNCAHFSNAQVNAVAGIGNPQRFQQTLAGLNIQSSLRVFSDHYAFTADDLVFDNDLPVIMTEKDAVKCKAFAQSNWFYLPICASLPDTFWPAFQQKIIRVVEQKKAPFKFK